MDFSNNKDKSFWLRNFSSWNEFVQYVAEGKVTAKSVTDSMQHSQEVAERGDNHRGTRTFAEALKLANDGWTEKEKEVRALINPMFDAVSSLIEKIDVSYDYEGHNIDVGRFVEGEPECWQKFETKIVDGSGNKIIRLVFNASVSAGIRPNVIIQRGAAIASLIELLEFAGHRVELILAFCGREFRGSSKEVRNEFYIPVKDANQPMDLAKLIYILAHPSVLRRLYLRAMELETDDEFISDMNVGFGYGRPSEIPEDKRGDIYIGHASSEEDTWRDSKLVDQWLKDQLTKQGIILREEK